MGLPNLQGTPENYKGIVAVLFSSIVLCVGAIIAMNVIPVDAWLAQQFGERKTFVLQLYFWASLGATVASYKFFAEDKEINELESIKATPDATKLRWPNGYDVVLYAQRILFSGVLGVVGAAILFAGLGYFDAALGAFGLKQKTFFIVFAFLVGIYQNDFLAFLSGIKQKLFQGKPKH